MRIGLSIGNGIAMGIDEVLGVGIGIRIGILGFGVIMILGNLTLKNNLVCIWNMPSWV